MNIYRYIPTFVINIIIIFIVFLILERKNLIEKRVSMYNYTPKMRGFIMMQLGVGMLCGLSGMNNYTYTALALGIKAYEQYTEVKEEQENRIDDLIIGTIGFYIGKIAQDYMFEKRVASLKVV